MFLDFEILEQNGIVVDVQNNGVRLEVNDGKSFFEPFYDMLKDSDLTRRNAERLADEFASKAATQYIFQTIERDL